MSETSCHDKPCCVDENPQLIIGQCVPNIETGKCVRASEASGCCGGVPDVTEDGPVVACCDADSHHSLAVEPAPSEVGDCQDSCCGGEDAACEGEDGCDKACCDPVPCPSPETCEDPEPLSCSKGCCDSDDEGVEQPDSIELQELGCADSCCASESASLSNEAPGHEAILRSNVESIPEVHEAEPSTLRNRGKGKEQDKREHTTPETASDRRRHHHRHDPSAHKGNVRRTKSRSKAHNNCATTVWGRFYEVACCCVLDSLKRASSEASKRKKASPSSSTPTPSPKPSVSDVERAGGEDGSQTRTMTMSIQGMDCPSCAKRVTTALLSLPSVRDPKVNTFAGEAVLSYTEGSITPTEIAHRATTITGFRCEVIEQKSDVSGVGGESRIRRLKVFVNVARPEDAMTANALPLGVTNRSAKRSEKDKCILEVDYDARIIQPRNVLSAFSDLGGIHIPQTRGGTPDVIKKDLANLLQRTIISALCCIPVLVLSWAPIPHRPIAYGSVCLVLTSIIQLYVALPIYSSALRSLFFQRIVDMDLLVALSTSIAYAFSIVAFALEAAGHPFSEQFFETSALLVTLIMLGRLVSALARRRASSALDDLAALQANEVILVQPSSTVQISDELVHTSDILRVLPETLIPTDGIVVTGTSEADESSITGESLPVAKVPGNALVAGTLNLGGVLEMRVTRVPAESTLADIAKLLRDAQDAAAALPVQDRADRAAAYLAPVVLALSVITFLVWMFVGVYGRGEGTHEAGVGALKYAIAVMVISCPCAIALAVPMVVVLAVSVAAKRGVLFKSVVAVQYAKDVSVAVFDKTGTLTEGKPSVVQAHFFREDASALVAALTSNSKHPISKAVFGHLSSTSHKPSCKLDGAQSIPGQGVEARYNGLILKGGSPHWLSLDADPTVQDIKAQRLTPFVVTLDGALIAAFGLEDGVRACAIDAATYLRDRGVEVHIVSGDEPAVVAKIAERLGVPISRAIGGCSPQGKQEYVKALQVQAGPAGISRSSGQSKANGTVGRPVMFVGDGTNDSLALVQADVGVSLGSGTDVAMSAADVVFMDPENLARGIRSMFDVSDGAVTRIKGNFLWSAIYNLFAILLASGAFVDARVSPQYAGLGEMISVLPVVLIAWSMTFLKK